MLFYHYPIIENNLTISIDNIVLDIWVANPATRDMIEDRLFSIAKKDVELITWDGGKPGTFRNQFLFKLPNGTSFWLGHGLIGNGIMVERYRLEFNPNKLGNDPHLVAIHELLVHNCRKPMSRIARFDLAIDIPVDRAKCFLIKDRRLYIERRHGKELTQYLGAKSSTVGRVKLYNKSVEAKLDYPLTRLELTLDPAKAYGDINFPAVYYINAASIADDGVKVTDTERFILNALLQGFGTINDLGRKTRAKIEKMLKNYVRPITISEETYACVLAQLDTYLTGSGEMLNKEQKKNGGKNHDELLY